jgi:hypothetical protein
MIEDLLRRESLALGPVEFAVEGLGHTLEA